VGGIRYSPLTEDEKWAFAFDEIAPSNDRLSHNGTRCKESKGPLKGLERALKALTEHELLILRRAGAENDPIIITAINLFNATVVE
jgi:hypothetical protein